MRRFCYALFLPLLFGGCVSLMEKSGRAIDGSAFAEKKIAVYRGAGMEIQEVRNKAGERSIFIALNNFPSIKIRGSAPNEQGEFYLTSVDYLGGNTHGWNEYRLDLSGYGRLVLSETTATLSIPDEIESVQISSGRIRRYDTRITGDDAEKNLRNRRERIQSLAEWMNAAAAEGGDAGGGSAPVSQSRKNFEKHWRPLLFPEMVPSKKRPQGWQQEGDSWVWAEDIRWNSGYTQRTFPEELRAIRDSGTMLRDWEEAFEWIYVEHEWPRIAELLSQETVLTRARK
jgi:hypothetical protein